jgi:ribosomal protein S19E (S16A)
MFNYENESTRILNKYLRNKRFMKMDLNKLVHNIDSVGDTDTEDEAEETEEQQDFYYIRKNGYMKKVYFTIPAKTNSIKSN